MQVSLRRLLKPLLSSFNPSLSEIITHWQDIIGHDKARYSRPLTIQFDKRTQQTILKMTVLSTAATEYYYQKDALIERINHFFCQRIIDDIHIIASRTMPLPKKNDRKNPHATFDQQGQPQKRPMDKT